MFVERGEATEAFGIVGVLVVALATVVVVTCTSLLLMDILFIIFV